jgi:polar amino acid transport system substrate-binding protein
MGAGPALAMDLKGSLAQMPVYAESPDKGVLVDLVKAIAAETGSKISIQVAPFKRSLKSVIDKKVDFHMPLIKNPQVDEAKLPYDHSTATIFHVNFVLYSNKNKPLDLKDLGRYKLETDSAHIHYFPFKIAPSSDIASSLKKLNVGRIDGFIFADNACDPLVKKLGLNNVKRQLYKVFDVKIILPKGQKGGDVDKFFSDAIKKLKAKGEYVKIMGKIDQKNKD